MQEPSGCDEARLASQAHATATDRAIAAFWSCCYLSQAPCLPLAPQPPSLDRFAPFAKHPEGRWVPPQAAMEATIVCIDNSEWTRNGDYAPTRFQAQADAVNLLAGAKTQANPENTVGVLTMAGKTPRVLVTPTPDLGKVLNCMTDITVEGETNIAASVQIAQLALKHRQNKNQRQRIVIFAGSPVAEDKVGLVQFGAMRRSMRAPPCMRMMHAPSIGAMVAPAVVPLHRAASAVSNQHQCMCMLDPQAHPAVGCIHLSGGAGSLLWLCCSRAHHQLNCIALHYCWGWAQ